MLIIGLTGGIGSGKSTVTKMFLSRDIPVIDADIIARQVVEPEEPAFNNIINEFGTEVVDDDGHLNRAALRKIIFENSELRDKLEKIIHPYVREEINKQISSISAPYCIISVPLLVDIGEWESVDRILVIDAEEETQIQRVMERDVQPREDVIAILDAQISRQMRLDSADDVILNEGDLKQLESEVNHFHEFYLSLSKNDHSIETADHTHIMESKAPKEVVYEQPLNERIRTFLKLEILFERALYHTQNDTKWDAQELVATLIEIVNLTSRGDIKSEIIKELERQHTSLKRHQNLPNINQKRLTSALDKQQQTLNELHAITYNVNQHLKSEPLFNIVNQRITIPGGISDFDIPAFSHWLNLPHELRANQYSTWLEPFNPIKSAINVCLNTIRDSGEFHEKTAETGFYQQSMTSQQHAQLIRVMTELNKDCYPEISAGRHRFSIRFFVQSNDLRPKQCEKDVLFNLAICGI